jgi:uncharacterized membrane protein YfcA
MDYFLLYLLLGAFAGVMAGLLGVGGGLIIVPVLAWIYQQQGVAPDVIMHLAIGTSLATIVFTSISSVKAHHARDAVLWRVFWILTPGIIVGALFGAAIADYLPTKSLSIFFGLFELFVAIQMTLSLKPQAQRDLPGRVGMSGAGTIIGSVSSIVGIGGGTMTVPFLVWCNVNIQKAIATSAACGLPIAIAGAVGFMLTGLNAEHLPAYSLGYVNGLSLLGIVATSVLFAPLGAKLAHTLPADKLKKGFAVLLFLLAVRMLFL